jgi:hypothetical protein
MYRYNNPEYNFILDEQLLLVLHRMKYNIFTLFIGLLLNFTQFVSHRKFVLYYTFK